MNYLKEEVKLEENIRNESALYYYRATPFTQHSEFNYNGKLKENFFFQHMFSREGMCDKYISEIKKSLSNNRHKSILLIGNQGCGKTTFVHNLKRECGDYKFAFFDFDEDTSNPTLSEYIEKLSSHLQSLLKSSDVINKSFYNLFLKNKNLIDEKINADNKINKFFDIFKETFLDKDDVVARDDFIKIINTLFLNQILSLIMLWYICKFAFDHKNNIAVQKIIFCLDNLDVLVNKEIIENFFKEYFLFVRNVDSIIQNLNDEYVRRENITYNSMFVFVLSCRQHTWARVKEHYPQDNSFVQISTLERNITDAFDKRNILKKRKQYISDNSTYYSELIDTIEKTQAVLADMDATEKYHHNIYDLFDDDYRQCNITFDQLLTDNPGLFDEYSRLRKKIGKSSLYGVRGIIYKALFDKFKQAGIFDNIGVLDMSADRPLVSNARMILNFLNYYTYTTNRNNQKYIAFEKIVDAFKGGIINKEEINNALCAMFNLGYDSPWNELIAFKEIHSDKLNDCSGLEVFITKAGHEYLSLIATHFEFFNTRVTRKRTADIPLFSEKSIMKYRGSKDYQYYFQETISLVLEIVKKCCKRMSEYYATIMEKKHCGQDDYLDSHYVYSDANVLHGERIIHTHIRYIDTYRLFILHEISNHDEKRIVNEILIEFIEEYIQAGEDNPDILTQTSTHNLFPAFRDQIKIIRDSKFEDFKTKIDVIRTRMDIAVGV